jgi:hypothetical protein
MSFDRMSSIQSKDIAIAISTFILNIVIMLERENGEGPRLRQARLFNGTYKPLRTDVSIREERGKVPSLTYLLCVIFMLRIPLSSRQSS